MNLAKLGPRTLISLALLGLSAVSGRAAPAQLVIEHATVLPMTSEGAPLRNATVVIRDGRIAEVGPDSKRLHGFAGTHVDATGQWLIPGLTDAHVHLENDGLMRLFLRAPDLPAGIAHDDEAVLPYLANGVLQIVNLQATPETFAQIREIDRGDFPGPHIVAALMIDGDPPIWPVGMTQVAKTPEQGRRIVRQAVRDGYDLIKVYSRLDLATFTAIVDEARQSNIKVVGHIPGRGEGRTADYFQRGYTMVAHAEEFAQQTATPDESAIPAYVAMAKRNGTGLISTLTLDERIIEEMHVPTSLERRPEIALLNPLMREVVLHHNPYVGRASPETIAYMEKIVAFNRKLIAAFRAAGVPILAGTDAQVPGVVPGASLPDELEALVAAGLTPKEALDSATRLPNVWLGSEHQRGVIAAGARADMVLLDADPLKNISAVRQIHAVVLAGRVIGRAELEKKVAALKARTAGRASVEGAILAGLVD